MKTLLRIATVIGGLVTFAFIQLAIFPPSGWDTEKLIIEAYIFGVITVLGVLGSSK